MMLRRTLCLVLLAGWLMAADATAGSGSREAINRSVGIGLMLADHQDEFDGTPKKKAKAEKEKPKQSDTGSKKSVVKAALLSAIVPGAGEYYVGNHAKARTFFVADALTWTSWAAFRVYGHWKKDDYIRYAKVYAGANLEGKSEDFQDLVGFYTDIIEYNTLGRVGDPERPYLYDTPENHWRWQSSDDQAVYRGLKNRSREAYRRARFVLGIAVANRIVSVLDAIRDARRSHRTLDPSFSQENKVQIQFSSFDDGAQVQLALRSPF